MNLSASDESIPQVKAIVNASLLDITKTMKSDNSVQAKEMVYRIAQFMEDPDEFEVIPAPQIPNGSPIGSFQCLNE